MKNMRSTLSHYQMLGVSFMRERETAGIEPAGGIVADAMVSLQQWRLLGLIRDTPLRL